MDCRIGVMEETKICTRKSEQGVALAGAAIAMTIALGLVVGLVVSVISTQSDISDTDTSQRALAAAEGGAESFLSLSTKDLENWVNGSDLQREQICETDLKAGANGFDPTTGTCTFKFAPAEESDDEIEAQATVSLETYNVSHGTKREELFEFYLSQGGMREVKLGLYKTKPLAVCWDDQNDKINLYVTVNSPDSEEFGKILIRCNGINCPGWTEGSDPNAFLPEPPPVTDSQAPLPDEVAIGYTAATHSCFYGLGSLLDGRINSSAVNRKVRVYAVPVQGGTEEEVQVGLIAEKDSRFPEQGYKITSVGKLTSPSPIQIEKRVTVYRSHPYLPGIFDFALYSEGRALQK